MPRGENLGRDRRPGPGRPKGMKNRVATNLKTAVEEAFDRLGGVAWLVELAKEDPAAFCSLLGRLIPKQIEQSGTLNVEVHDFRSRLEAARKRARASGGDVVRPEFQKEAC